MINEDNVIINTPEKELETEPQNIPQGEKPFINPNPGYGYVDPVTGESETKPAIKTEPVSGERGIRSEVVTPLKEGVKVERNLVNFLKGLLIKGKPLEEYIDSQGGVTEEELQAALTPIRVQLGNIDLSKFPKSDDDPDSLSSEEVEQFRGTGWYSVASGIFVYPLFISETETLFVALSIDRLQIYYYILEDGEWTFEDEYGYDLSGGTKLYKHHIIFVNEGEYIDVTNNISSPIADVLSNFDSADWTGYSATSVCLAFITYTQNELHLCYQNGDVICSVDPSNINDTVTPL